MKKIILFITFCIFISKNYSQGIDVLSAEQFCSGTSQLLFPNVYGGTSTTSVGCLGSTPNAAYFFMQIDNPGNLIFTISQENTAGTPIDVDFIAWGPFIDINDANANISFTDCPTCPNNTTNPTFYPYTPDQITDCSFDIAPTETMSITNALQGQIYVVLITNYNGEQGNISFQQTGGTGTTTCENSPICGSNFYDTGGTGGNYGNNETETTTIYPYFAGGTVTVDFTSFNVNAGDVLTVYNGPDATFPVLGTVSGAPSSFSSTTVGNPTGAITFVFTSNATGVSSGWESDISCTPPPTPPTCGSTFYDSGGPSGTYSNNENQTTTFFPDTAGEAVTATFTLFDLEFADDLYVYDGPDAASPLLGIFNGNTVPGPFTSSHATGALTFVFDSDFSVTYDGWAADLTCAPYVAPPVCGTTFYDSGGAGGNYPSNANQTTTLIPDIAGTAITATFTDFNIESCCDSLTIYDGPNTGSPLLGTFTGTTFPPTFTSSDPSGALTFVFTSDSSVTGLGWAADVTCITLCNDNITTTTDGENCGEGTVNLSATATSGATDFYWYTTASGGTPIATTSTGDWTTPIISSTTTYYVSAYNGSCESDRIPVVANILPEPTDVTISTAMTPIGATSCNLQYAELTASGGEFNNSITQTVLEQDFESGLTDGISGTWTTVNNSTGGTPANAAWTIRPDSYYAFIYTFNSNDTSNFILSDSDDQGSGSNTNTELRSPVYSLEFFTSASLNYYHHYNDFGSTDNARVEISTNGGTTWETTTPLRHYTTDQGDSDGFVQDTIDLSAYLGQTTLQIRFKYTAAWDIFWAIDNISLEGEMNIPSSDITWAPTIGLFTDASLTTPYTGDPATTVYAAPNGTQIYSATAEGYNGCIKTETVTITRNGKTWMGLIDNNWYVDGNWEPNGVPTEFDCVLIPDANISDIEPPIADESYFTPPTPPVPAYALNLTVAPTANLEIASNTKLVVTDWIHLDGTIDIRDAGSLIQITDGAPNTNNNTGNGNINMRRTATIASAYDYIYWSTPVEGFNVTNVSPGSSLIYQWIPTISGNGAGNYGNWQATTETMLNGKGYIIRNVAGTPTPSTPEFVGRPNNGVITKAITRGSYNTPSPGGDYPGAGNTIATRLDDNWNLVGNPYPSAISADAFIAANAGIITDDVNSSISGTVYLWRHLDTPSNTVNDPFYGDFVYNYNPNDYIAYNSTGSNPSGFGGDIAAGQAFFVLMEHAAATPSDIVFSNSMRNETLNNSQFYRTQEPTESSSEVEKHRIWLDLIAPNNHANSILVGYVENATNGIDKLFDGFDLSKTSTRFYSLLEDDEFSIQGKALPFTDTDLVPLGLIIPENGNYTIAINSVDGLFSNTNQDIFLEDTYLNIIHDLRYTPYSFNTDAGTFNDRFILRYTNNTLNIEEFETNAGISIVAPNNSYIKITSSLETIKSVTIYDVLGRVLYNNLKIHKTEIIVNNINNSDGVLFVKAVLDNGIQKTQKVVIKQ